MAQPRILVVGKYYPPYQGGTEVYTKELCERLSRTFDVTALVHADGRNSIEQNINNVRVVRCGTPLIYKSQPISPAMFAKLRLDGVDLVHFNAPNFFANAILLSKLLVAGRPIPIVVTHHMDVHGRRILRFCLIWLYKALLARSTAVIVTSNKNARLSRDLAPGSQLTEIPLGIDVSEYLLSAKDVLDAKRFKQQMVGESPAIAFVGRHARYKGLEVLIQAVGLLPGVHALIAGDGPYREPAQRLSAELSLEERVHFLGPITDNDKKLLIAGADIFAFPSTEITEAFGIAQLEAMALGTPIVASDLPTGVTDIAIHERTALLSTPRDYVGLARNIKRLLEDRNLARLLANSAKERVLNEFSKDQVLNRTAALFESVLQHNEAYDHSFA